jgi:hypothetical protein
MAENQSSIEAARFYISRGLYPIPAPWGEKGSRTPGWQHLRIRTEAELQLHFNGMRQNVGGLLGDPPGLSDVDKDAPEARWAWAELGLETGFTFGRRSNPDSHSFFLADPPVSTRSYVDPLAREGQKATLIELRCLKKTGEVGLFQLLPPSRHPSGEEYEWARGLAPGAPARVDQGALEAAVAATAVAVLLARHFQEGARHHSFLALAGALARWGWHRERTENLVRAIYRVLWREAASLDDADREVADTYAHFEQAKETTGLPTLRNLLDPKIFDRLLEWLDVSYQEPPLELKPLLAAPRGASHGTGAGAAAAPAPKKMPEAFLVNDLRGQAIPRPRQLIEEILTQPGVTLLCSAPRGGKTVLGVQLCMSVANGLPLFDWFKTEQTPALLIEWDDPQGKAELQQYLEKARAARDPMPFHAIVLDLSDNPPLLGDPEFLPYLRERIRAAGAGLVVLDNYSTMRGSRAKGSDIVLLDMQDMAAFNRLAVETNSTIVLLHHTSKSSAAMEWGSQAAGTYGITAASDALLYLARYPELAERDGARMVSLRSRRMGGNEFCVRFREESKDFDLIFTGPGARHYPEIARLHRAFPSAPFLQKEAAEALGLSQPTISRICARLVASGVLRREPLGWTWDPNFDRSKL